MKILLIGEYSRLHNSLKEGLIKNGHEVLLIASGDGFKNYPVDIYIGARTKEIPLLFLIVKLIYKLFKLDIAKIEVAFRFYKILPRLKGFDVVQLINEDSIKTFFKTEIWFLKKIINQNKKLFLLSCGTDFTSVKYAFDKKLRYSILTPLHNNPKLKKYYKFILNRISTKSCHKLHKFLYENIEGVIASDIDYHIPLKNHPKYLGLIPNPINIDNLKITPIEIIDKVIIFHGINRLNYYKKGSDIFEKALEIVSETHSEKIEIIIVESLPYTEYINKYNRAHIILDQVFAYDQGFNALEAMAKGKVVFTGAEQEWLDYYSLKEDTVVINALPDADAIAKKLEWLILNPGKIKTISINARAFVEREHHYVKSAKLYLEKWGYKV